MNAVGAAFPMRAERGTATGTAGKTEVRAAHGGLGAHQAVSDVMSCAIRAVPGDTAVQVTPEEARSAARRVVSSKWKASVSMSVCEGAWLGRTRYCHPTAEEGHARHS